MNCLRDPTVAEMSSTEGSKLISSHVASDGNVYPVQTVNVKNVKIINFQKNPFKFITKADLFVLSSKFEGLPNVLLEAMALKKLVISTNCPTGPKEILANGKNGVLFKISDYKALSKIFMKIYSNKKKFNKHIINANKDLKKFDFELNCKKYLCTINSLIN